MNGEWKDRKITISIESEGSTIVKTLIDKGDRRALMEFLSRFCEDIGYPDVSVVETHTIQIDINDDIDTILREVKSVIGDQATKKRTVKRIKLDNILLPPAK